MKPGIYYNPITLEMVEVIRHEPGYDFSVIASILFYDKLLITHFSELYFRRNFEFLGSV